MSRPDHEENDLSWHELDRWAEAEFRAWSRTTLRQDEVEARLLQDMQRLIHVCLYRIQDGTVEFHEATGFDHPIILDPNHMSGVRATLYLNHLRDVVRMFGIRGTAVVGVYVADLYVDHLKAPLFFFQKPAGGRGLLLPDIDLLIHQYCVHGEWHETQPFETKNRGAIFVGSTTGSPVLTRRVVEDGTNPRLSAALAFRERTDVIFDLPNIVQVDGEDTARFIAELGVMGQTRSLAEQQAFRYLISIDGNGATCARVALALYSNSVLLKYASPNVLYYFRGLQPWKHYVPINDHDDVLDVLDEAPEFESLHREIAAQSRYFAEAFLTRLSIMRYTAVMLTRYITSFGEGGATLSSDGIPLIDSLTHLSGYGDRWTEFGHDAGLDGRIIEGLTLTPANGIPHQDLEYWAILADGQQTAICIGGQFCGSKGQHKGIRQLSVRLTGPSARRYRLNVVQRFASEEQSGAGSMSSVKEAQPLLTGFRCDVEAKGWWR